jgi:hypothetical protein
MRTHDSNVYRIHEFCVQAGMIIGDPQSNVAEPDAPAQLAIMNDSNSSVDGALFQTCGGENSSAAGSATLFLADAEVSRGEASVVSLDAMVNYTNSYQWGLLPVSTLEALLRACLPQIFTVVVVKAMCARGAHKKNQAMLAAYLELVTNMVPNGNIPKNMTLRDLIAVVTKLHTENGGRGSDLILPVDWVAQGVYKVFVTSEGHVMVTHRFLKKTMRVKGTYKQEQRFYVEHNQSEIRATVHEHDSLFQQPLYQLFHSVERPSHETAKEPTSDDESNSAPSKRRRTEPKVHLTMIAPKPPPQSDVQPVRATLGEAVEKAAAQLYFKPRDALK